MIQVIRYTEKNKKQWDAFCKASLNGVFLFYRDYMDYHSDRFTDHSLLFYKDGKLIALLPCNEKNRTGTDSAAMEKVLSSHDGLTFGSFIIGKHTHQSDMLDCMRALTEYCVYEGIAEVTFKPVPVLLQRIPSEQDIYAFIYSGAGLRKAEPSVVTKIRGYIPNHGEKQACRCAEDSGLLFKYCEEEKYWIEYHKLLTYVLHKYHNAVPVHSLPEILLLHKRFPKNIKLFGVFENGGMIAGTVIYEYNNAIHTQYMSANEDGREKRAMQYCIYKVIEWYGNSSMEWLDFGTSMLDRGLELDKGLISFKEGFKGNSLIYNTWSLKITDGKNES